MEALREALADSEAFIAYIPPVREEKDEEHCHQTTKFPYITCTLEEMQIKEKHDILLYYTGYIGSSEVSRIQVELGFTLSIMPRRVMQHLGIAVHRLNIYGFNANGTRPMGKIKLKCQIGDLKSEVTCY